MARYLAVLAALVLLGACSDAPASPAAATAPSDTATAAPRQTPAPPAPAGVSPTARATATPPPAATPAGTSTPAGTVRTVAPGQEFSLRPAETVAVAGTSLALTLVGVTNDSRCPTDVVCVWAGEATVVLAWQRGGEASERLTLTFAPGGDAGAAFDGHMVTVLAVLPLPLSTAVIAASDYELRLVVEAP